MKQQILQEIIDDVEKVLYRAAELICKANGKGAYSREDKSIDVAAELLKIDNRINNLEEPIVSGYDCVLSPVKQ